MVYELYVDSLFLVNFVMNLYLLILVNRSALRTATRRGMVSGACVGALIYLLPFCLEMPAWLKWPLAFMIGTGLMIGIAFRPGSLRAFGTMIRQMFRYSFLMGGLLLFVGSALPALQRFLTEICGVLGVGALGFLLMGYWQEADNRRRSCGACTAVLVNGETRVRVSALLDSGNSLREPISGKPVSVIDSRLYHTLWEETQMPYRAIPYRSIGRQNGILRGYLLPRLELELDGVTKCFCDVYLAVCEEEGCAELILNPAILEEL